MQNCVLSHACVKVTGHDGLSSSIALHFKFLRQGLSLNVNPANSARLVCWANSHDPPCVCPTVRDYGHTAPQPYFVLFIVQWRGERGGGEVETGFSVTQATLEPQSSSLLLPWDWSTGIVSNTTTDKYLKLQCVRAGGC